jgi:hypothetical protein
MEPRHFARRFTINCPLLQISAFISRDFSLSHTEFCLQPAILPVQLQNDQCATVYLRFAIQFIDLVAMQEKFANPFGGWNFVARFFVGLNVSVVKKRFTLLDPGERIADVRFAGANGFNFATLQLDSSLVPIEDVKIAKSLAIEDRLSRHTVQADACG